MIGWLRAFVWMRWRILLNSFRGTRRRDTLERVSRATSAILPLLLMVLFIPSLLAVSALAVIGGWAVGAGRLPVPGLITTLRVLLGVFTVAIVIAPAIRSMRGGASGLSRFILLPVPVTFLFLCDALSALFDPWLLLLVPVLLLLPVGIATSGQLVAAALALLGGIGMLALFLGLETSIAHGLALLYRNRRRGEMVTLIVLVVMSFSGFIPMMVSLLTNPGPPHHRAANRSVSDSGAEPGGQGTREGSGATDAAGPSAPRPGGSPGTTSAEHREGQPSGATDAAAPSAPRPGGSPGTTSAEHREGQPSGAPPLSSAAGASATGGSAPSSAGGRREWELRFGRAAGSAIPSELYARSLRLGLQGRPGAAAIFLGGLLAIAAALSTLSWGLYRRLLSSPEVSGAHGKGSNAWRLARRWPGLSHSASAVAGAFVRLVLRSLTGKMAIYFSPVSFVVFLLIITRAGGRALSLQALGGYLGPGLAAVGLIISMLALQKITLNQFAVDGAGLTLELLAPISGTDLVLGKAAGGAVMAAGPGLFYVIVAVIFSPRASIWLWAAVLLSAASAYAVFAPAAAALSALFPKTSDLNRIGNAANPSGLAGLIGFFIETGAFLAPVAMATFGALVLQKPVFAFLLTVVWALVAAVIAVPLFRIAARTVDTRRENLALVAQGR